MVSLWAYAYEFLGESLVSDETFDGQSYLLQQKLNIDTNRPDLDLFFRENFTPDTGIWVQKHPEIDKLKIRCEAKILRNDWGYWQEGQFHYYETNWSRQARRVIKAKSLF